MTDGARDRKRNRTIKTKLPEAAAPSRAGKRGPDELRPVLIRTDYFDFADGSAYIEMGKTKVVAAATIDEKVPPFLKNSGTGWVTAEYAMLPCATEKRTPRERPGGRISGRTQEIQRLIGRSLRSVTDLPALGETTIAHRLRRAPGRRRDALGLDHGRLRRPGPGPEKAPRPRHTSMPCP